MLTLKEWDAIASRLEPKVFSKYGENEQTFLWALYGGLLQHMKDSGLTIDEVLVICEEKATGKKKGLSKKS
ncbi:hypothetical protein [Enterococcus phage vB_Efm10_KEN22]